MADSTIDAEFETATGARLDEIAAKCGVRERRCLREDHEDGFGAIWEADFALRDRIRAKLVWEEFYQAGGRWKG